MHLEMTTCALIFRFHITNRMTLAATRHITWALDTLKNAFAAQPQLQMHFL